MIRYVADVPCDLGRVRRIEWVSYAEGSNLRTLSTLLISVIAVAMLPLTSGCKSPVSKSFNTQDEIKLGQKESEEVEKENKLDTDSSVNVRVQGIAGGVLAQAKLMRPDMDFRVKVLQSKDVNAFSLPGGWIYLNSALIDKAGSDDDSIACVIGHEAAHVVKRHIIKQIQDAQSKGLIVDIFGVVSNSNTAYQAASLAYSLDQLHFSRTDEYEADKYGLMFAYNAGYDPNGMSRFFNVLEGLEKRGDNSLPWANDHPINRNRKIRVEELIKVLRENHGTYPDDTK